MKLKDLWQIKDFRDTALKFYENFKIESIKADERYDTWGSFQYKNWWYDLNLYIDDDDWITVRDCIYATEIDSNGNLQTGEDYFLITKPNGELI